MAEVVVCGAGIAGISTAFHLARSGITDVTIVDPRPPLTLTSDKSTECYRNWWPNEPMIRLMGRSIDLLDKYARESDNTFALNRRGYLYLTADPAQLDAMAGQAATASRAGAGELRVHRTDTAAYVPASPEGFEAAPVGADLFLDGDLVREHFPFVADTVVGGLHARTAGWLSAQRLGTWMLEEAQAAGVTLVRTAVTGVGVADGRVQTVTLEDGQVISTHAFVNAAGPHLKTVAQMVGVDLPVHSEVHAKTGFRDHRGALPRDAPMVIWSDRQAIDWSAEETQYLMESNRTNLVDRMPAGCHARPEGGPDSPWVLGLWEYQPTVVEPRWPIPTDELYTEVVLRGLSTMLPAFSGYQDHLPEAVVDAGYYTKTAENRPLAGPVGPNGSFVCGALSGFGIMAACAVGELVATAVAGADLPDWSHWFDSRRYDDPAYVSQLNAMGDAGQL
jgi:glycine/D-amino acid oxidase-like deaminating enzyme